jgi:hypothetical protein
MDRLRGYRFGELGWLQFQQLCTELLEDLGVPRDSWLGDADGMRVAPLPPALARTLGQPGALDVAVVWARRRHVLRRRLDEIKRPTVVISNRADSDEVFPMDALSALLDARPDVRRRVPFVLGVRPLEELADTDVLARSTLDVDAAAGLARVFVPTTAYRRALTALGRHGFAVLTGPPEMGKTAAARTIALAALAGSWEAHECLRPEQFWDAYRRDRAQIFIADDAFGSTEYEPAAAERWALDLDRILGALDESHHLVWTSRPGPLHAALRRIHREHGVERWPRPAEIEVDAAHLELEEKALILFRHTQASEPTRESAAVVRAYAASIVANEHFTPERIRRFVTHRLPAMDRGQAPWAVDDAIRDELREPTQAMASSLDALPDDLRALLVALVDAPPGPVAPGDLAASLRRHAGEPTRPPFELAEVLADHFVRVVPPDRVTWVHPSWRDLVIDRIAADPASRRGFLDRCTIDGLLLALSTHGGAEGVRTLPLLVDDADWDVLGSRLFALVPELDDRDALRLLLALEEALPETRNRDRIELVAVGRDVLGRFRETWDHAHTVIPVAVLAVWLVLAESLSPQPGTPDLTATWIELAPTRGSTIADRSDLQRLDEWLVLVAALQQNAPEQLRQFGFPDAQEAGAANLARSARELALAEPDDELLLDHMRRTLNRLWRACPSAAPDIQSARAAAVPTGPLGDWWEPDLSTEPSETRPLEPSIVARIMRDLRAA